MKGERNSGVLGIRFDPQILGMSRLTSSVGDAVQRSRKNQEKAAD